jgi:hypothetical protein
MLIRREDIKFVIKYLKNINRASNGIDKSINKIDRLYWWGNI